MTVKSSVSEQVLSSYHMQKTILGMMGKYKDEENPFRFTEV